MTDKAGQQGIIWAIERIKKNLPFTFETGKIKIAIFERTLKMIKHMNEPQIREQLTISQQQGTLVEVYNFADDDTFNVGFVIAMDPLFVY